MHDDRSSYRYGEDFLLLYVHVHFKAVLLLLVGLPIP